MNTLNSFEKGFVALKLVEIKKDLQLPAKYYDQLDEKEKQAHDFEVACIEKAIRSLLPKRDIATTVFDERTIKKTLTIPNYLNVMGEAEGINFSKVLTEALKDKLL